MSSNKTVKLWSSSMPHYFTVITLLFLMSTNNLQAADSSKLPKDTVIVTSDNWCPFTCLDTAENKGLLVEVVVAAFNNVGLKVRYDYTASWGRAIQNVQYGRADVLLGVDNENNNVINLLEDYFIYDETVFAVKKDSDIVINDGKDLQDYSIGVLAGYGYADGGPWEDYIEQHQNSIKISVSKGAPHLLNLLVRDRFKIAVVNWNVAKKAIKADERLKDIKFIRKDILSKLYIGFAKTDKGDEFKEQFLLGFKQLIGTDKLRNIYSKYDINMPKFTVYN